MTTPELHVVTGAFGYTGKYITRRLLAQGKQVKTLTGHPHRPNPFGAQVSVAPFNFDHPAELVKSLVGATTLYNTYWVRFTYGDMSFGQAVANTQTLIKAAEDAGVRRLVHVSITNPSKDSSLPYFKGKGILEEFIAHSQLSYAIIRPTVIFGLEDILINNIAWLLRRFPVFAIPGDGSYRLQPIYVEDMAELAVAAGARTTNEVIDAVGPDIFTFKELVELLKCAVGSRARLLTVPPRVALWCARAISVLVRDEVLTLEEVDGLMANLLISSQPPTGKTRLSAWLAANAEYVGARYASEVGRHYDQPR
jgi:NADH dehydrogenase